MGQKTPRLSRYDDYGEYRHDKDSSQNTQQRISLLIKFEVDGTRDNKRQRPSLYGVVKPNDAVQSSADESSKY
jgi:hypothetical protein